MLLVQAQQLISNSLKVKLHRIIELIKDLIVVEVISIDAISILG